MPKPTKSLSLAPGWAIYLRTSSKEAQNPKTSQERQRHSIDLYLIKPSSLPVSEVYIDTESGLNPNRTHYQRLLSDAREGKFSHVAVESPERFGRNIEEAVRAFNELKKMGIHIHFANNPSLEINNPMAEMMIHMSFMLGQFESNMLSSRVKGGQLTSIRNGKYTGRAPDGYLNVESRSTNLDKMESGRYERWIISDPKQFKVWRTAWDLLLTDRYTLTEICQQLHQLGYTFRSGRFFVSVQPNGHIHYAKNHISRIFHNWFYAGWNVSSTKNISPKTYRGNWEPVVSTEEFERGLQILESRNINRSSVRSQTYLLTKLIYLRHDQKLYRLTGSTPNASRKDGGTSYYFSNELKIHILCHTVDSQIPDFLRQIEVDSDLIPLMHDYFQQHLHEFRLQQSDQTSHLEAELERIRHQHQKAYQEYLNDFVSIDQWHIVASNLSQRRATLEQQLAQFSRSNQSFRHDLDTALNLLHHLYSLYVKLELKQQRELIQLLVKQLIVNEFGVIEEVVLLPPFMYLHDAHSVVKKRTRLRKQNTTQKGGVSPFIFRCSTQVSLDDPTRTRT